jgi:hypothetical protein
MLQWSHRDFTWRTSKLIVHLCLVSSLRMWEILASLRSTTSLRVVEEQKQLSLYSVKQISLACHIPESQGEKQILNKSDL